MYSEFLFNFSNKIAGKLNLRIEKNARKDGFFRPTFVVSATTRCNFHCPHCLRDFTDDNKTLIKDLSPDVFEIVLREGKKVNFSYISITGGEPILNPYFPELVNLIKKYNYTYNFTSNGWLYKDYWPIIEESRRNLDQILLSIDGATAEVHDAVRNKPGSFERLMEAARSYQKNKIPLIVTFVITKQNYHQIEEMVNLGVNLGIRTIKYTAVISLRESDDYGLTDDEKLRAFKQVSMLQEKFKNKINFITTANLVAGRSSDNRSSSPHFCTILDGQQLFIDHDGAMLFCCDLYQKCPHKPLIQELGFKECLRINFDVINEIKKQHAKDLLDNSLPKLVNFCDFCNNYVEKFLDLVQRQRKHP